MNNIIEFPETVTYWIVMNGESFVTYGTTLPTQTTESIYDLVVYPTRTKWKSKLEELGLEEEELDLI